MLRLLVRQILSETNLKKPQTRSTIFSMLFGDKDPEQMINIQLDQLHNLPANGFSPVISSKDVRSQVKYIRYNMMYGYYNEARDNLLSFMEYSQNSAPLLELYGEIMLIQEDHSQALEAFQKAVAIDPKQHLALGYLSCMTGNTQKIEEAIEIVKEKISKNPTHLDLINDYGKLLLKAERPQEALDQFQLALKANPNYIDARINSAIALAALDKADHAIETLLSIESKSPRIYCTLGEIFYRTGRLYLAYRAYEKAAHMYPSYTQFRSRVSELSNYMRKLDSLIDLHERFVNTNQNFPDLHAKLGNFYHLAGKSELAIEEFKKALKLNPDYQYASLKLETIQKDVIWRLAKTHLEEHLLDTQVVTQEISANLHWEGKDFAQGNFSDDAVIQIKNVRTGKIMQKSVMRSQIDQGFARIDCSPLGLVACQDILLFQIMDVKSKKVLRFEPHYLEADEIKSGFCDVKLSLDSSAESAEEVLLPKYFLIHLESKKLAQIIGGPDNPCKAILKNQNNGLEATGYVSPENDEQINFVLNGATNGKSIAAVNPGDKLSIKVSNGNKRDIFSMDFSVGASDIQNFFKTIVPQEKINEIDAKSVSS
jgi:tetratricopeptide (TPR) repeat protein